MWLGGLRDGKGKMIWVNGTEYYGDWDKGFAHG
jgi:hypothetical protein